MAKVDRITAFCPHCGNTAQQKLLARHGYEADAYDFRTGKKSEDGPICEYTIRVCETCSELLVYHEHPGNEPLPELRYPKAPGLPSSVPDSVRTNYSEAAKVQMVAPHAYAVMLRRALETLCHDRGVTEGNLHKALEELVKRGEMPPVLAEMTSVLRQLGNAGAHNSTQNVTVPLTWVMDDFFRAVVEYVYVAPSKLANFKLRLEGKLPLIKKSPSR